MIENYLDYLPAFVVMLNIIVLILAIRTLANPKKGRMAPLGYIGFIVGGLIGFLIRPSAPLVGQLPFSVVWSGGSNLKGLDQVLAPVAQQSLQYLLLGAIAGAILGAVCGAILNAQNSKKKEEIA